MTQTEGKWILLKIHIPFSLTVMDLHHKISKKLSISTHIENLEIVTVFNAAFFSRVENQHFMARFHCIENITLCSKIEK